MRTHVLALFATSTLTACGDGNIVNPDGGGRGDGGTEEGIPNLVIDKASIDFGSVAFGSTATETLTIKNNGTGELTINALTFSSEEFFATAGAGLEIASGSTTSIGIQYAPRDYAADSGTLEIATNDPDQPSVTVALAGAVVTDADGDGYDSEDAGGDDCDDEDDTIHPGAEDAFYDGKDSDCDGSDDYDQDGDGYQTDTYNDDETTGGGDCQDANADIHPGAADVWYDGVDSDCDGSDDWDQDGDGYGTMGHGEDCDDTDGTVNPDGTESFNGKDDDCDGKTDNNANGGIADYEYRGTASNDRAGSSVTFGDLNDDGMDEMIVGSYSYSSGRGLVSVFDGSSLPPTGKKITDAANYFMGDGSSDNLGYQVGYLESFGSSGDPAVVVGAPGYGGSYGVIYAVPADDALDYGDIDDAVVTVSGDGYYRVGYGFGQDIDLDGDGTNELFGYFTDSSSSTTPYLFLLYGDTSGSYSIADVDAAWSTDGNSTSAYLSFPNGGDINGDGYGDAIYCDHQATTGESKEGAVWALFGKATEYANTSITNVETVAEIALTGNSGGRVGYLCQIGDDIDGDGAAELWVYDKGHQMVWGIWGGDDLEQGMLIAANEAFVGYEWGSADPNPVQLRNIGDWSGDGAGEIAVGLASASSDGGAMWVYSSEVTSGTWDSDKEAFAVVQGEDESPYFQAEYGYAISSRPGDVDGDGRMDVAVGDYGYSGSAGANTNMGAVYLNFNGM